MTGWWAISYAVLWLLVVVLSILLVALARQVGALHLRLGPRGALEMDTEGPPLDEPAPSRRALDVGGRPLTIGGDGAQLLLFVSPSCPICREVLPSIRAVAQQGRLAPIVVVDDTEVTDIPDKAGGAPTIAGPEIAEAFGVPGTPYTIILDASGIVRAKGTVNNLEQMEGLVDTAERRISEAAAG